MDYLAFRFALPGGAVYYQSKSEKLQQKWDGERLMWNPTPIKTENTPSVKGISIGELSAVLKHLQVRGHVHKFFASLKLGLEVALNRDPTEEIGVAMFLRWFFEAKEECGQMSEALLPRLNLEMEELPHMAIGFGGPNDICNDIHGEFCHVVELACEGGINLKPLEQLFVQPSIIVEKVKRFCGFWNQTVSNDLTGAINYVQGKGEPPWRKEWNTLRALIWLRLNGFPKPEMDFDSSFLENLSTNNASVRAASIVLTQRGIARSSPVQVQVLLILKFCFQIPKKTRRRILSHMGEPSPTRIVLPADVFENVLAPFIRTPPYANELFPPAGELLISEEPKKQIEWRFF
jgi:hypothetical protein